MEHQPFSYHTLEELTAACAACGVTLPFSKDLSSLQTAFAFSPWRAATVRRTAARAS